MSPEAQRIALAEVCGWTLRKWSGTSMGTMWHHPDGAPMGFLPDYLNSLDAVHEAEKVLIDKRAYCEHLANAVYSEGAAHRNLLAGGFCFATASAGARAEAFLRTIGQWQDDQPATTQPPSAP
jgi:hypothetical protein